MEYEKTTEDEIRGFSDNKIKPVRDLKQIKIIKVQGTDNTLISTKARLIFFLKHKSDHSLIEKE